MPGPKGITEAVSEVKGLIQRFATLQDQNGLQKMTEEDVKISYIIPLLQMLQWDTHSPGEIRAEETVERGRIDLSLRTNPSQLFPSIIWEIKRPSSNLDGGYSRAGKHYSFPRQAIDYAWQSKSNWAVLTNFNEIRLYYSHVRTPKEGLIFNLEFSTLAEPSNFRSLWDLSKPAIINGSLNCYEKRRTRDSIDHSVVSDLYSMRKELFRSIIEKNSDIDPRNATHYVQQLINRFIVVRVAEDRQILQPETFSNVIEAWKSTVIDPSARPLMKDLKSLFRDFDTVYNSKLFEESLCEDLNIPNKVLIAQAEKLYKYNFDIIDADVLGTIYEDYVGHTLKEDLSSLELIEDDRVKKESGLYYTPIYITDYLVKHTVGHRLGQCGSWEDVREIKVVDPSCGSGAFLLKAFDYFQNWYRADTAKTREKGKIGDLSLHIKDLYDKERQIVRKSLFGVDIDHEAVGIASVNLMLKVLRQNERLPTLEEDNIKTGNALKSEIFDWRQEFGDVFHRETPGFDCIIGNPPWTLEMSNEDKKYYREHYSTAEGKLDLYRLFLERCIRLLRQGGRLGYIVPNTWLTIPACEKLRRLMLEETSILEIVELPQGVFDIAQNYVLLILEKAPPQDNHQVTIRLVDRNAPPELFSLPENQRVQLIPQKLWDEAQGNAFDIYSDEETESILDKIAQNPRVQDFFDISLGIQAYHNTRHTPEQIKSKFLHADFKKNENYVPQLTKGAIAEFYHEWDGKTWVSFTDALYAKPDWKFFSNPRILIREITGAKIVAAYAENPICHYKSAISAIPKPDSSYSAKVLLGILSSAPLTAYFVRRGPKARQDLFPRMSMGALNSLPIPPLDAIPDAIEKLVNQLLGLAHLRSWVLHQYSELTKKYQMTAKKTLKYFYDPLEAPMTRAYGFDIANSEICEQLGEMEFLGLEVIADSENKIKLLVQGSRSLIPMEVASFSIPDSTLRVFYGNALSLEAERRRRSLFGNPCEIIMAKTQMPFHKKHVPPRDYVEFAKLLIADLSRILKNNPPPFFDFCPAKNPSVLEIDQRWKVLMQKLDQEARFAYGLSAEELDKILPRI
ncbi:MAG: Eco57I restriction-modification methylase domain-containing protein [Candidatus Hodarchaeales archaeon]|jgi:type I restriction-modification system DNA methylase subunit